MDWKGIIHRYREYLPVSERTPIITLNEGWTPLIEAKGIGEGLNIKLFLKYEGLNPTGSFKDRGMTVAISKAIEEGSKAVICASTGNTSASAAAYAARAGLRAIVLIPEGAIAMGKLAQAIIYGADVIAINGNFDECLDLVKEIASQYPVTLVNSLNPFRIEGQKTGAFEICDQLGEAPEYQAIPVGNAGNITAYWKGYKEYEARGMVSSRPKILGFQAEGAAPIVDGRVIPNPKTVATAIRIGNPASWKGALEARDESGGLIAKVTDEEIKEAYRLIASREGIFVEPASAAGIAGVLKLYKEGYFPKGSRVVSILTGHGLKDPEFAIKVSRQPEILPPNRRVFEKIESLLEKKF